MANINLDTLISDKRVQVSYNVYNHGKLPAMIESTMSSVFTSSYHDYRDTQTEDGYLQLQSKSYIGSQIMESYKISGNILKARDYELIKSGKVYIFLFGALTYINPITYKKFVYKFKIRMYYTSILVTEEIENSNTELIKSK